ncbi:cyclopropane-fatty-acyl-phospholipid synthase family protein [Nitratireductor sp. GZWM139]|uniref:SAM-dependent methyltransferase n=1 Tax=Nitratireductor sp. GZWM139 TaxID=2950541 RepID=UPI0024BD68CC|nr:cyclopropane-fatty-acyl-phospholipid synthase family protein [Nitratireductor sp. GZWM139]MDJ1465072.1 cyclopropane-fatty-acyl-phospholipid synthase family protein [Nitratireductor sp. GZWM139]
MSHIENVSGLSTQIDGALWQRIVCRWADAITIGRITLRFPDGQTYTAAGEKPGPAAALRFNTGRGFMQILSGGSTGFAKAYLDGHVDTPDLDAIMELALANENRWQNVLDTSKLVSRLDFIRHRLRRNSRSGSRRNIAFHYDLGNAFYRLWLDDTMTYSSALYEDGQTDLEQAQIAKYDRILERLGIGSDDRVLEIGCGWGGFAEHAIRKTGCHVTGLTLSTEQADYARARLSDAGLSQKADIRLQDYRDCQGRFTKIVSIEMFEAVGEENWPLYFARVRDLLVEDGRALLQVITIDETRFDHYRRNADFIQKYIFPGGMLPSPAAFINAAGTAGMAVVDELRFGPDYATTLAEWETRFRASWEKIEALGFDERFYRMWLYYLAYCRTGFRTGRIDVVQFELVKP